jgi:hypothetical protein
MAENYFTPAEGGYGAWRLDVVVRLTKVSDA